MPDVGFRYPRADLLKAVAARKGLSVASFVRALTDAALEAEGFSTDSPTQYALVSDGEVVLSPAGNVITTFRPQNPTPHVGEWYPIENEDSPEPYVKERHYRLAPLPLRVDGERGVVVREYPVVAKSWEHA